MLQEWLEELAEDEMKKTASSQFEEVLEQMDIPELVAFYEMNNDLEKQAAPSMGAVREAVVDPAIAALMKAKGVVTSPEAISAAKGALSGGAGGAATGGLVGGGAGALHGAMAAEPGSRLEGMGQGALSGAGAGAALGGLMGAGAGGVGGAMSGMGTGQLGVPAGPVAVPAAGAGAALGGIGGLAAGIPAGIMAPGAAKAKARKAAEEEEKTAAEAKVKQAAATGQALARMGFLPEVIKPTFAKHAQAPAPQPNPFAPRLVQADPVNREQFIQDAQSQGRLAGGTLGGMTGAIGGGMAGSAIGERIGGGTGALIGGLGGAALGGVGLGYAGAKGLGSVARKSSERLSDEEMQEAENYNLADKLYSEGQISDEEMRLAEQQFFRGPQKGTLTPQTQQMPMPAGEMPKAAADVRSIRQLLGHNKEAGKASELFSRAAKFVGKRVGEGKKATQHAGEVAKQMAGKRGGREMADFAAEQAGEAAEATGKKVLKGTAAGAGGLALLTGGAVGAKKLKDKKDGEMPKAASFRDTILKVAQKGALPQNHGWEL